MTQQKALIEINREYEGIHFLYNDFADESPLSLVSNLHIGNHRSPFLKICNRVGYGTSVQFMADNSNADAVFVAMFALEGKVNHLRLLNSLRQFDDQIRFDASVAPIDEIFQKLSRFKGMEELFYAILTHKQIVIISDQEIKVRKFILELVAILPAQIFRNRTFLSHADRYRSDIDVLGLADTKKNLKQLNDDVTIVMLADRMVFGLGQTNYTTMICDRIQALDTNGYDLLMDQIMDLVHSLSGTTGDEESLIENYDLSSTDAQLVLALYKSTTGEY